MDKVLEGNLARFEVPDVLTFLNMGRRSGLLAMERALAAHRGRGYRLGQALLAEKLLSEAELASFLKVQVSEVIFDTFEWKDGVFTFWDKVPPPATAVTLLMDLQNLIMEGSRRI